MVTKCIFKKISVVLLSTFMISLAGTFIKTDYVFAEGPGDTSSSDDEFDENERTPHVNSITMEQSNASNRVALPSINRLLNDAPILLLPSSISTPTTNNFSGMQMQTQPTMPPLLPQTAYTPNLAMNSLNNVNLQNQPTKYLKSMHRREIYGKGSEAQKIKQYLGDFDAKNCHAMYLLKNHFPVSDNGLIKRDALYSIMNSVNSYLKQNHLQPFIIPRCAKRNHSVFMKYIDNNLSIIAPILNILQII